MTINSKLIEQDKLIREHHEAIKRLKTALKMVLKNENGDVGDVGEDGVNPEEARSVVSDVIYHHNSMISECKDEIERILILLDLEF